MEQGIVYVDADEVDRRALHIFRREERDVVSYARLFPETDKGMVHMGRVLTTKRGRGLGREVVEEALSVAFDRMEAQCVRIDSQVHVAPFYAHLGFCQTSDVFVLEGVEHVKMELSAAAYGTQASRLRLTSNNSDGETAGGTPASHAPAAAYGTQASRLWQADSHPAPFAPAPPYDDVWRHFNPAFPYPYSYKYPRASVTADCILFSKKEAQLHVLLIRRGAPPYEDHWAFPCGFLEVGKEDTEQYARREL